MMRPLFSVLVILLAGFCLITAPAYADRDGNRGRGGGHDRHHHRKFTQRTVVVRPSTITLWPTYPGARYYYGRPREVKMICPNGKDVTIKSMGLSVDEMLSRAHQYCARQTPVIIRADDVLWGSDYCREYQVKTTIGGKSQNSYGQACMRPDGSWEIMN